MNLPAGGSTTYTASCSISGSATGTLVNTADVAAPGVLLAQAVGRWGNWFNQELFGGPTDAPWGLSIDPNNTNFPDGAAPGTLFHPTFLYESLWCLAAASLLMFLDRKYSLGAGSVFALYIVRRFREQYE